MNFKEKYTNSAKKAKNMEKESQKLEISIDSYVIAELLQELTQSINRLTGRLR